jgi:hypothetical protein
LRREWAVVESLARATKMSSLVTALNVSAAIDT